MYWGQNALPRKCFPCMSLKTFIRIEKTLIQRMCSISSWHCFYQQKEKIWTETFSWLTSFKQVQSSLLNPCRVIVKIRAINNINSFGLTISYRLDILTIPILSISMHPMGNVREDHYGSPIWSILFISFCYQPECCIY